MLGGTIIRISDLQTKKIISITSGKNMGTITDAEVSSNGQIDYFLIQQNNKLLSFNKENEKKIKWNEITKIGEDVVLVKIE